MYEEYYIFAAAAILTTLLGSLKLIRGNGVGDYVVNFLGILILGLVALWIYRKLTKKDAVQP
ncbi:hypothetical protein [uncultured Methanoregula sp.]|uniref:hypothetical protein n=1 Tax=uncultured Methanoregula sp. TaxID=1005933 RepID=UPI002AAC1F16|nr:hypothetical protein [uncultured Methanoregula sp.]